MSGRKRSRSLGIWLLLGVLVAGILIVERADLFHGDDEHGEDAAVTFATTGFLPAAIEDLTAVELAISPAVYRFERDGAGAWYYHAHIGTAEEAQPHQHIAEAEKSTVIEQALNIFGRTQIARQVGVGLTGEQYGVTSPSMVIAVYGADETVPLARYVVGDLEPDEFRRYVLMANEDAIVTIPDYQIENLRQLAAAFAADPS